MEIFAENLFDQSPMPILGGLKQLKGNLLIRQNLHYVLNSWQQISANEGKEFADWLGPLLDWDFQYIDEPIFKPLFPSKANKRRWLSKDAENLTNQYNTLLRRYPDNLSQACGWGESKSRDTSLQDLLFVGNMSGASILDLGCGPGSVLSYLKERGVKVESYTGVDVNETMLKKGKEFHPEADFLFGDCFDPEAPWLKILEGKDFDYVLLSSVFSCRPRDWSQEEFNMLVVETIGRYLQYTNKGLSVIFIPEIRHVFREKFDKMKFANYHLINRMELVTSLSKFGWKVRTAIGTFDRIIHQTPIYLHPNQ